jgi:hypothetical protein
MSSANPPPQRLTRLTRLAAISTTPRPTANAKSGRRTSKNVPHFTTIAEQIFRGARLFGSSSS